MEHAKLKPLLQDVLDIAVEKEHASLVTVLRFIRINDICDPTSEYLRRYDFLLDIHLSSLQ